MPKYVFGTSVKLPAGQSLTPRQLMAISAGAAIFIRDLARSLNPEAGDALYDAPFEHVTGDWLPADENGHRKIGPSRPIDLLPEHVDHIGPAE